MRILPNFTLKRVLEFFKYINLLNSVNAFDLKFILKNQYNLSNKTQQNNFCLLFFHMLSPQNYSTLQKKKKIYNKSSSNDR